MLHDSPYLPWSDVIGPAFLASAGGFALLALAGSVTPLDLSGLLAASLAAALAARAASRQGGFRVVAAAIPVASLAAAVSAFWLPAAARPAVQVRAFAAFAATLAPVIWSTVDETPARRQRRTLWAAAAAGVPVVWTKWMRWPGMPAWTVMAPGLFVLAGGAVYMWSQARRSREDGSPAHAGAKPDGGRRYAIQVGMIAAVGAAVICLVTPGLAHLLSAALSLALKGAGAALYIILKPIGYLVGWAIDVLARLIAALAKKPTTSEPSQPLLQQIEEQLGEYVTPVYMVVIGRILACAAVCLVAYLVWRAVKSGRRQVGRQNRTDDVESLAGDARSWMALKAKELAGAATSLLKSLLPGRTPDRDALVDLYARFLEAAARAGTPRNPGDTPLEFGIVLARDLPTAGEPIMRISREFSRGYYSGRRPEQAALDLLEQDFRTFVAAAREGSRKGAAETSA